MIDIKHQKNTDMEFVDPIDLFGATYGKIYQQYMNGVPQKDFMITTGTGSNPVSLWYDDELGSLRLSSETKKDLKEFVPSVKYRHLPKASLDIVLRT